MSPVEYNLAALASISGAMERPKSSGLSGSSSSVGGAGTGAFTLADLISNVGGDHEGEAEVRWSEDQSEVHHGQQGLALSNLAALAKLEEMERQGMSRGRWPPPDPNLLLPLDRDREDLTRSLSNLGSDAVSLGNHSLISPSLLSPSMVSPGHSSISPPPLQAPSGMAGPSTSPLSPLDNLMPGLGLGSQSVSPIPGSSQPILRSGINMAGLLSQPGSAQPR